MRRLALSVIALATGCTASLWSPHEVEDCESPRLTASSDDEARVDGPVIMTLRTRDHDVVVHGGDDALRFTITMPDGAVLGRMLDDEAFAKRFPELHRHFESAYAEERAWAGL
jgi:hypothetical protein